MKSLPKVNQNYLDFIQSNEKLYSISPIELKRQIWSNNPSNFDQKIRKKFSKFIKFQRGIYE